MTLLKRLNVYDGTGTTFAHVWLSGDTEDEEVGEYAEELKRRNFVNIKNDLIDVPNGGTKVRHVYGERGPGHENLG